MSFVETLLGRPAYWQRKAEALLLKWEDLHLHTIEKKQMGLDFAKLFILAQNNQNEQTFNKELPFLVGTLRPRVKTELMSFAEANKETTSRDNENFCPPTSATGYVSSLLFKDINLIHETLFGLQTANFFSLSVESPDFIAAAKKDKLCPPMSYLATGLISDSLYDSLHEQAPLENERARMAYYRAYLGGPALEYMCHQDVSWFADISNAALDIKESYCAKRQDPSIENNAVAFLMHGCCTYNYAIQKETDNKGDAHQDLRAFGVLRTLKEGDILLSASKSSLSIGTPHCLKPVPNEARKMVGVHFQAAAPMGPV